MESLAADLDTLVRIPLDERHIEMTALHGDDHLAAIDMHDRSSGETRRLDTRAVFVMVGAAPNTGWLSGCVELDEKGFVKSGAAVGKDSPFETSRAGIYVVGDVRAGSVKRVASSVGEGSVVISKVWEHVEAAREKAAIEERATAH